MDGNFGERRRDLFPRLLHRRLHDPDKTAATGDLHEGDLQGADVVLRKHLRQFVHIERRIVQLRTGNNQDAVLYKAALKVSKGAGDAIGGDNYIRPGQIRGGDGHEHQLDRPVLQLRRW